MKLSSIMISYNPDLDKLSSVLERASVLFDSVYIFDNASKNSIKVKELLCKFDNVFIEQSDENVGISGLNCLAKKAFSDGADFISIIDQDSVLPNNFRNSVEVFSNKYSEAVCAPIHTDINRENQLCFRYLFRSLGIKKEKIIIHENMDEYIETDFCIGSGMTVSQNIWEKVGGFDDTFFIDCADLDFCLKLFSEKIKIYLMSSCLMKHEIGSPRERVIFFNVSMHKPIRHYYYFSSILCLLRKKTTPCGFKLHYMLKLIIQYIVYSFLVTESNQHRKEINRAIIEFFTKR